MSLRDLLRLCRQMLGWRPLRSLLCVLSVAVGAAALSLTAALGLFGKTQVEQALQTVGMGGLSVSLEDAAQTQLSASLAYSMRRAIPALSEVMPLKISLGTAQTAKTTLSLMLLGVDEQLPRVMQLSLLYGALPNRYQVEVGAPVIVLDNTLALRLCGRENAIGDRISLQLDGQSRDFTVCGIVRPQTAALGGSFAGLAPDFAYLPYACLATDEQRADQFLVRGQDESQLAQLSAQIEGWLTRYAQVDGRVRIHNLSETMDTVQRLSSLTLFLIGAAGGITLLVALLGLCGNLMAAVYERQGQIGILLALGARPREIGRLFLLEAVLICGAGGLIGLALTAALLFILSPAFVPPLWLLLCIWAGCLLCGIFAALLPAHFAARQSPVDAIRE